MFPLTCPPRKKVTEFTCTGEVTWCGARYVPTWLQREIEMELNVNEGELAGTLAVVFSEVKLERSERGETWTEGKWERNNELCWPGNERKANENELTSGHPEITFDLLPPTGGSTYPSVAHKLNCFWTIKHLKMLKTCVRPQTHSTHRCMKIVT